MTVKHTDLIRSVTPLRLLCEKDNLPFHTALIIANNVAAIDSAIEAYLQEKDGLNKTCLTSDGASPTVIPGCEEEFLKKLTELNDRPVEVNITPIPPSALANITFPPKFIHPIAFMLDTKKE